MKIEFYTLKNPDLHQLFQVLFVLFSDFHVIILRLHRLYIPASHSHLTIDKPMETRRSLIRINK